MGYIIESRKLRERLYKTKVGRAYLKRVNFLKQNKQVMKKVDDELGNIIVLVYSSLQAWLADVRRKPPDGNGRRLSLIQWNVAGDGRRILLGSFNRMTRAFFCGSIYINNAINLRKIRNIA
jgi:hypothetical protein